MKNADKLYLLPRNPPSGAEPKPPAAPLARQGRVQPANYRIMKTVILLFVLTGLLSGCASDPLSSSSKKPSGLPSPEKITSDINMTRAFPKSVETGP